jgi:cell division protein FtsX
MSIASVGVLVACMAIIGVAILLTSNLNTAMSSLEKENVVMAYLEDKNSVLFPIDGSDIIEEDKIKDEDYFVHNEDEAKAVCAEIEKLEYVEKVEFISAEQALNDYKENLLKLKELPWFNVSLKYGIAIELQDKKTMDVLKEFIGDNGEIIQVYNANLLKQIIQIIVLTASKVKSQTSQIRVTSSIKRSASSGIKKAVSQALAEVDDWEW